MANELNTIVESSLGGLAAGRTIATVRVVDDTGGSANASPTQIREMTGIDHSILTEQIVPGEFYTDLMYTKKQVYTRTLAGTMPSSVGGGVSIAIPGISNILSFNGYVFEGGLTGVNAWPPYYPDDNALWVHYFRKDGGQLFLQARGTRITNSIFIVTIKYTKQ